jgi:hypothetical protein
VLSVLRLDDDLLLIADKDPVGNSGCRIDREEESPEKEKDTISY